MRQFDTAYSIPNIDRYTKPGRYSFLDQMIVGDVPYRKGSAYGPGLNYNETVAHMSMWVMAASPLLTCTDVRNMTAEVKNILTNPEAWCSGFKQEFHTRMLLDLLLLLLGLMLCHACVPLG
jgi:hypothetical protein